MINRSVGRATLLHTAKTTSKTASQNMSIHDLLISLKLCVTRMCSLVSDVDREGLRLTQS